MLCTIPHRGSAYSHTAAQRSSTSSSTGAWHRNPELFRSVSREGLWVLRVHAPAPAVFQVEVFDGANAVTTIPCVPPELYQDFVPDKLHPATPEELRALSAPAALGMPTAAVVMPRSVSPMEVRSVSPMMNDRSALCGSFEITGLRYTALIPGPHPPADAQCLHAPHSEHGQPPLTGPLRSALSPPPSPGMRC